MSNIIDGFQRGQSVWEIVFGADKRACIEIMSELSNKLKNKIKLNKTDLRNFTKYHCFTLLRCTDDRSNFVSECPLTDKQCLRLIALYNKHMIL